MSRRLAWMRWLLLAGCICALTTSQSLAQAALFDLDGDEDVDFDDFFLFADNFGRTGESIPGDFYGDGQVDYDDFFLFGDHFGLTADDPANIPDPPGPGPGPYANAGASFDISGPMFLYDVAPGQEIEIAIEALGLVGVEQFEIVLQVTPADAFDLAATSFAPGDNRFIVPGEEFPAEGQVRVGGVNLFSSVSGDTILGTFNLPASPAFDAGAGATIEVVRIGVGPGAVEQDVFDSADLGLMVRVNSSEEPVPRVKIKYPNGGEVLGVGEIHDIHWFSEGAIAAVAIEYSPDNGATWGPIAASAENTGEYAWQVPGPAAAEALIRISDADAGEPSDISNAPFEIALIPPVIRALLPSPEGLGYADSRITVGFDRSMDPATLNTSTFLVVGEGSGSVSGTVEYDERSHSATFFPDADFQPGEKVTATLSGEVASLSGVTLDGNGNGAVEGSPEDDVSWSFEVREPLEIVAYPTEEAPVIDGRITSGEYSAAVPVYLEFTTPDRWPGIVPRGIAPPDDPADLSYTAYLMYTSEDLYIAVDVADDIFHDDSPQAWQNDGVEVFIDGDLVSNDMGVNWEFASPEGFQIWMDISGKWGTHSPELDEGWFAESRTYDGGRMIEFRIPLTTIDTEDGEGTAAPGPGDIIGLNLSADDDDDGGGIEHYGAMAGNYENWLWHRESDWGRLYFSPDPAPMLSLVTPNGSEAWGGGSVREIRWVADASITSVAIDYSLDGGNSWSQIASGAPNTGSFAWTLPLEESEEALVRLVVPAAGGLEDVSDWPFVIREPIPSAIGGVWTRRSAAFPGEPFNVYAEVYPGELDAGPVRAELYSSRTQQLVQAIDLADDGTGVDEKADDGVYSAQLSIGEPGGYSIDAVVEESGGETRRQIDASWIEVAHTIIRFPDRVLTSTADLTEEGVIPGVRVPMLIEDDGDGYLSSGFLAAEFQIHLWGNGLEPLAATVDFAGSGLDEQEFLSDASEETWGDDHINRSIRASIAGPGGLSPAPTPGPGQAVLAYVDVDLYIEPRLDHMGLNIGQVSFDEDPDPHLALLGGRLELGRGDVDLNRTIDPLDASLVLMHTVRKLNLYWPEDAVNGPVQDEYQFELLEDVWRMADVTGEMGVTALDAALILRRAVDPLAPFPAEDGAYLLWEEHAGWWDPPLEPAATRPVVAAEPQLKRVVGLGEAEEQADGTLAVPVVIDEMEGILAGTFALSFDPGQFRIAEVRRAELTADCLLADHAEDGTLRVSFAGTDWKRGSGTLAEVVLRRRGEIPEAAVDVRLQEVQLNEGDADVRVDATPVRIGAAAPVRFALHANYPNPFNPQTTIRYDLAEGGRVSLKVFNLTGQAVRTLRDEVQPAGHHRAVWNGLDDRGGRVASGVYLCRLETGGGILVRKMLLVK